MQKPYVICDIHHTVALSHWRDDLMTGSAESFDDWHKAADKDPPVMVMIDMLRLLSERYTIVANTSTPEKFRKLTMEWLIKNSAPFSEVWMRPDEDFQPTAEFKLNNVFRHIQAVPLYRSVALVIDSREDVLAKFSGIGITTLLSSARRGDF